MTIDIPTRLEKRVVLSPGTPHERSIHRVALAPLTRMRNTPGGQAPTDMAVEYYAQRASEGGLLITEAAFISKAAGGYPLAPGIYTDEQVESWKKVTDAVHVKGGLIYIQLWNLGRANAGQQPDIETIAPSPVALDGGQHPLPREMTVADIDQHVRDYKTAAENSLKAGFDGVEIHDANGYLLDQFLQKVSNKRTDDYGGSLENRSRFTLRVLEAVSSVYGQERTGIRFSPWGRFQDMLDDDPYEIFVYVNEQIAKRYPKLGYVHFVEPRNWTGLPVINNPAGHIVESNDIFRAIYRGVDTSSFANPSEYAKTNPSFDDPTPEHPTLFLSAAGHDADNVREFVERTGDVAAIGRYFISNPDLPERLFKRLPVTPYDRSTFYSAGPKGYTDYPTYQQEQSKAEVKA